MKRYLLIKNIGELLTMTNEGEGALGTIRDAECLIKHGRIEWFGKAGDRPQLEEYLYESIDAKNGVVMPGLVDSHTHLVHGGSRELEVEMRSQGKSYEKIARSGGGIVSTVTATRDESLDTLLESAFKRADEAMRRGITTIEVKSGYGLDLEIELKMLEVIHKLNKSHPLTFISTFMGAHTIPKEYKDDRKKYVDLVVDEMIPKVAGLGLAEFCDVFVENIAFTYDEGERILDSALTHGLRLKVHADQLSNSGGALLAAAKGAVSADHLEYTERKGVEAMVEKGVVAVFLPGSTFYIGGHKFANAREFIDAGAKFAIATDYNPGTTPSLDLFLMATICMTQMKMTIEEVLKAITLGGALALDLEQGQGMIKKDGVADLIILDANNFRYPIYRYGHSCVQFVIKNGRKVFENV